MFLGCKIELFWHPANALSKRKRGKTTTLPIYHYFDPLILNQVQWLLRIINLQHLFQAFPICFRPIDVGYTSVSLGQASLWAGSSLDC